MRKLCLLLLAAGLAPGQEGKTDFSGAWELQVSKSDFGPLPPPESQTYVVEHKDPKLKINTTSKTAQGERKTDVLYTTDGQENTNEVSGATRKSKTRWAGKDLVTEAEFEAQGSKIRLKDTWRLGEDGKTFTIDRAINSDFGEAVQKLIFAKK